ncbi:MAG: LuxR C-terminal-related transcriptional regulator [Saprospiraceae bacterium]
MKRTILIYGLLLAFLTGLLQFIEYRYWVRDLSIEFYVGAVAVLFTAIGIWVGLKLTKGKPIFFKEVDTTPLTKEFDVDGILEKYNISKREHEVLILIAKGLSNKEIASTLFLSTNTIKTHSSNLFAKLDVKRRTQAVQKALELGLLTEDYLSN